MKLKWDKVSDTHIEGYLGKYQVVSVFKEHDVYKWFCELPFSDRNYAGREHGKADTIKRAALDATDCVNNWLEGAKLA